MVTLYTDTCNENNIKQHLFQIYLVMTIGFCKRVFN